MKASMRARVVLACFLLASLTAFLAPAQALAFIYWAKATEGWVVDAETGRPLEGVIVVAHWPLKGGPEGGNLVGVLHIFETFSDSAGRYVIPAWGPKFALSGSLGHSAPAIYFFKPGYAYRGVDNESRAGMGGSGSEWDRKAVQLSPYRGDPREYVSRLGSLSNQLWRIGHGESTPCGWESFPRMILALAAIDTQMGTHSSVYWQLKANEKRLASAGCRPLAEALKP